MLQTNFLIAKSYNCYIATSPNRMFNLFNGCFLHFYNSNLNIYSVWIHPVEKYSKMYWLTWELCHIFDHIYLPITKPSLFTTSVVKCVLHLMCLLWNFTQRLMLVWWQRNCTVNEEHNFISKKFYIFLDKPSKCKLCWKEILFWVCWF